MRAPGHIHPPHPRGPHPESGAATRQEDLKAKRSAVSQDPFLDDLLRQPRSYGGRSLPRRWYVVALVLVALGALIYGLGFYEFEESPEEIAQRRALTVVMANEVVLRSIDAARAPLSVADAATPEAGDKVIGPQKPEIARWQAGKTMDFKGVIARNQSVSSALQKRGLSNHAIHLAVSSIGELYDFRQSRPGNEWTAHVNAEGHITRFRYKTSPEDIWESRRKSDGTYMSEKVKVPLLVKREAIGGKVTTSLWQSMEKSGLSASIVGSFIDIFSGEIDFKTTTQPGDEFAVLFETIHLDGEYLRTGRVLAARYKTPTDTYAAYFYETEDEAEQGYYNAKGTNLQRLFLKNPLSNVRITSTFGKRFHPVLKRWKMHSGVDYGAPTGTPVMSVADGTVSFSGWKGANGNLVTVKHKNGYTTHYAHLSYIPRSIKSGVKVTKKTLIGKVGSTGRSTGPHLHFGMSKGGKFVDPLKVDIMRAPPLRGKEMKRFDETVLTPVNTELDSATSSATTSRANPRIEPQGAKVYEDNGEELY